MTSPWRGRRSPRLADEPHAFRLAVALSLVILLVAVIHAAAAEPGRLPPGLDANVSDSAAGRALPKAYLGLSMEYSALESYAGANASGPNPYFIQLVRNLAAGQSPLLRIGGDSADWTWWPVAGMARPPGVNSALDQRWLSVARSVTRALGARLILGLNLEADSATVAAVEAQQLLHGVGARAVSAFELGNEPELYGHFPWYRDAAGHEVQGRPPDYSFDDFQADFTRISSGLPSHPLSGPSIGGPGWLPNLPRFFAAEPRVRIAVTHRYPLQLCHTSPRASRYPTVAHLLSRAASTAFAAEFVPAVAAAHARGLPLLIDELNTVSCGAEPAVSQTFASALWALDTLFELDRAGVDGVLMHTFPGAGYELFAVSGGRAAVSPEYYGLLAFVAAAPPGSRLLDVSAALPPAVKVWATRGPDGRERVVVINKNPRRAYTLRLRIAGHSGPATIRRLTAPGVEAHGGASWGGQVIAANGRLAGPPDAGMVSARSGRYPVRVAPGSAALITLEG